MFDARKRFYNQTKGCSVTDVIKHSGGKIADDKDMETYILDGQSKITMSERELKNLANDVKNRIMGEAFLLFANRQRFGQLIEGIRNNFIEGQDRDPTSINNAYHCLTNHSYNPRL